MVSLTCSVCGGAGSLGTIDMASPAWWSQGTGTPWVAAGFAKSGVPGSRCET